MNLYGLDHLSLYEYGLADPVIVESLSRNLSSSLATIDDDDLYSRPRKPRPSQTARASSPPKNRHDGTSPLPLGMDWSLPPRVWDGRGTVWPHNPHTGWSYCVTVPSWSIQSNARGSDSVVFYRVQVGIQSPEGVTTTRGILRRFNDFLELSAELRKAFPQKKLPPAPSKRLLKTRSRTLLEERRCALEDWMQKLLSDIDLSRTATAAIFLELEAAARSSFYNSNQGVPETNSATGMASSDQLPANLSSPLSSTSSITSDYGNDSAYQTPELGTPTQRQDKHTERDMENVSDKGVPIEESLGDSLSGNTTGSLTDDFIEAKNVRFSQHRSQNERENSAKVTYPEDRLDLSSSVKNSKPGGYVRGSSNESIGSDGSSRVGESSNLGMKNSQDDAEASRTMDILVDSGLQPQGDLVVALPSEERQKMNRVLITTQQGLGTAKTDMEDLIARLNQENAVRQYLTTKVKDLELELETTRLSGKENLQQANLVERERFTELQWDMEELQRKYMEVEMKLKSEEEARLYLEFEKESVVQKNEMLLQELDDAREEVKNWHKHHDEMEMKSKSEVKLLIKEVKALRSSQSELKQELGRCLKEILDLENDVQKDKERREVANASKKKLLRECQIIRDRLQECSVNFHIGEDDKLIVDSSSPSDVIDLLITSDNRIGLLLAEAQLLAQDVESAIAVAAASEYPSGENAIKMDEELRKMLTDMFVDNASLRKQVNSVIRCALRTSTSNTTEGDNVDEAIPQSKTVLSDFL